MRSSVSHSSVNFRKREAGMILICFSVQSPKSKVLCFCVPSGSVGVTTVHLHITFCHSHLQKEGFSVNDQLPAL